MMKFKIGDPVWLNIEGKFYHYRGYVKGVREYEQYGIEYPVVDMIDAIDLSNSDSVISDDVIHCIDFLPEEQWELIPGAFVVKGLL